MMRVVVLCCVVLVAVKGQTTEVSQCTSNPGPLPINTYIEGCVTPPCMLPQAQDAIIHIIFKAPRVIRSMRTLATAFVPLIGSVEYRLGDNEVTCNFLANTYCPVVEGEVILYTLNMYIERIFPTIPVTIEFRIVDEKNDPVVCIRVPVRITSPINTFGANNSTLTGDV